MHTYYVYKRTVHSLYGSVMFTVLLTDWKQQIFCFVTCQFWNNTFLFTREIRIGLIIMNIPSENRKSITYTSPEPNKAIQLNNYIVYNYRPMCDFACNDKLLFQSCDKAKTFAVFNRWAILWPLHCDINYVQFLV